MVPSWPERRKLPHQAEGEHRSLLREKWVSIVLSCVYSGSLLEPPNLSAWLSWGMPTADSGAVRSQELFVFWDTESASMPGAVLELRWIEGFPEETP